MKPWLIFILLIAILLLVSIPAAQADPQAYDLSWWSIDSGGGQTSGGVYNLQGVAGQPDAGILLGGNFSLSSGYLSGTANLFPTQQNLFLPLVFRP
jgi:hypothetical protein